LIGIIALAAVIGFSMTGCGNGSTSSGGPTGGNKLASLESEHFIISCEGFEENESTLFKLRDTLEGNYNKVTTTLQVSLSEKSNIRLYPDQTSYNNSFGNTVSWSVGNYRPDEDEVRMVTPGNPPRNQDFNSLLKVGVHEWVHLVAWRLNASYFPYYIVEGVAVYLAGQNGGVQQTVASAIRSNKFPATVEALELLEEWTFDDAYNLWYAFAEYVVHKYGNDVLVNFYKSPVKEIYNTDPDGTVWSYSTKPEFQTYFGAQFISDWKTYCTGKYK
jgi:hypothetical protein